MIEGVLTEPVMRAVSYQLHFFIIEHQILFTIFFPLTLYNISILNNLLSIFLLPKGLSTYLNEFAFESATEDGLFFYLGEAGERDGTWPGQYSGAKSFSEVMKEWTNQVFDL